VLDGVGQVLSANIATIEYVLGFGAEPETDAARGRGAVEWVSMAFSGHVLV